MRFEPRPGARRIDLALRKDKSNASGGERTRIPTTALAVCLYRFGCAFSEREFRETSCNSNDRSIQSEEPSLPADRHLLIMLFRAAFRAASGLARSLVASSNAAFIELQNFPIWGILGITIPFWTFS